MCSLHGQVTFVIESLPSSTPETDTIFMVSSLNNWNLRDTKYILHPQVNGNYSITIPKVFEKFEYKFARGSWMKVETDSRNNYRPNRIYIPDYQKTVYVKIENWQDLGGAKGFNYIVWILFVAAFNGVLLLFLTNVSSKYNRQKFSYLNFFNVGIVVTLIGGVFHSQTNLIWQSHIAFFGYIILSFWGPCLTVFLANLNDQKSFKHNYFNYLPMVGVILFVYFLFINFKPLSIFQNKINFYLSWGNILVLSVNIGIISYYHITNSKYVQKFRENGTKSLQFIQLNNLVYFLSLLALLFLIGNFILLLCGIFYRILIDYEIILIILSLIIFVELYYFLRYPDILKEKVQYPIGNADELKNRLCILMENDKPFKNAELNIAELSDMLGTKPHILSKVINEYYNKNFRDYINEFRVNEFIKISISEEYKNYTFLAIALEVGFNSKSTFNLAFKKATKLSPSEYFKQNPSEL